MIKTISDIKNEIKLGNLSHLSNIIDDLIANKINKEEDFICIQEKDEMILSEINNIFISKGATTKLTNYLYVSINKDITNVDFDMKIAATQAKLKKNKSRIFASIVSLGLFQTFMILSQQSSSKNIQGTLGLLGFVCFFFTAYFFTTYFEKEDAIAHILSNK